MNDSDDPSINTLKDNFWDRESESPEDNASSSDEGQAEDNAEFNEEKFTDDAQPSDEGPSEDNAQPSDEGPSEDNAQSSGQKSPHSASSSSSSGSGTTIRPPASGPSTLVPDAAIPELSLSSPLTARPGPRIPSLGQGGLSPFVFPDLLQGDLATLLWAPRNHRRDIRPTLRYRVESYENGVKIQTSIKYLDLRQHPYDGVTYEPRMGLFSSALYLVSQPYKVQSGYWNRAKVSLVKEEKTIVEEKDKDKDKGEGKEKEKEKKRKKKKTIRFKYYLWLRIYGEELCPLPELEPEAIWQGKPVFEYVKLKDEEIDLEVMTPLDTSDRLLVVTHDDIGGGKTRMVMKIWPSPMCSSVGIEREMMAYRACDGKDITPKFLGHVAEEGRVIGFLAEYIEGARPPRNDEKELCRNALKRFHELTGWHRNSLGSHRFNFLVKEDKVYLVDLALAYTPQDVASMGEFWAKERV